MNSLSTASDNWQFDRRLPLAQQVYADLRRRIISLDLPPDCPLSRVELSQHYQISQTPLREALQKLGEEGLVATYPQSRHMAPYLVVLVIGLLLVAFVPWFSLVAPRLLNMM